MRHPDESRLALFVGGELGLWARAGIARHLTCCQQCRREVRAFRAMRDGLREASSEMPDQIDWTRLATEMKANIRVGLAAGECIASAEPERPRMRWRAAAAAIPVAALILMGLWLQRPRPQLEQAGWADGAVLRVTSGGIELRRGDRMLSLQHPAGQTVTYSANTQGTLRARYVDPDTGQVTIHNVYPE